jgi:myo-inositol-1(or 4)-monophosphatase
MAQWLGGALFTLSNLPSDPRRPEFMTDFSALGRTLAPLVHETTREAGAIANTFFRHGDKTAAQIWSKAGGSPVTEADIAVDVFLKIRLSEALPEAGWLSEETADDPSRLNRQLVWIVDPIDGTRAFLSGHPDWSVAIALLADGRPVLGVVHAPALDAFYEALKGEGARLNGAPIKVSSHASLRGARVAGPKPLVDKLEHAAGQVVRIERIPSLALRIARVAEGRVDLGLVSSDARDWDLAGADLVLQEAGGRLTGFDGEPLVYNQPEPLHGELAVASNRLHPRLIEAMTARRQVDAAHG